MKYFTKEWYDMCQRTMYHYDLRADKRAESFSEEYFRKLYAAAEAEHMAFEEHVCNISFDDVYPEKFDYERLDVDGYTPEQLATLESEYYEMRDAAKDSFEANTRVYDPASAKCTFRSLWKDKLQTLAENLPGEILHKVADIRVLALGRASAEVKKAVRDFCKANERSIKKTVGEYRKYFKKAFAKGAPAFAEEMDLHDCEVTSCRKAGKNVVLRLDNSGGFTNATGVTFRNAEILCREKTLRGARWLYDEIYKTDAGYEIHALLWKNEAVYFTVTCSDAEISYS